MALTKTISATHQYNNNALSPVAVNFTCEAEVQGGSLVVPHRVVKPGVFTAGTPSEGYTANTQEDSNG